MIRTIISANAPKVVGPYSHAVQSNNTLYVSGQIGIDIANKKLTFDIASQTKYALSHLETILKEAGFAKKNVVKTTVYLANMSDYQTVNKIYAEFFGPHKPARTTIQVAALPIQALIEIDAIATKN